MKKSLKAALLGAALALGGVTVWEAGHYLVTSPAASLMAVEKPLTAFSVDPAWVRDGQPNFRSTETVRSPDGQTITGLWACDGPTTFEWRFGLDETVHLLEGRVEVTYLGRQFVIEPGDTATFHAGTTAIWHVPKYARKAYTLHHPGRLVLLWRRLFPTQPSGPGA
ncbi:MAG: hypothetical protein CFE46_05930 [Burkholderiales bacterium PBB6]|nr:MAG: hypothetical protein CFE46_05930 [Burkholderiales bacterium PBB6]